MRRGLSGYAYPETQLSYPANVYNEKARAFYRQHGVQLIDAAYEAHQEAGEVFLMLIKHCPRFSFDLCPKQAKGVQGVQGQLRAKPMALVSGNERYTLRFDCKPFLVLRACQKITWHFCWPSRALAH